MSTTLTIALSHQAADPKWGNNAILTSDGQGMQIHLTGEQAQQLEIIQRAARRLQTQGINNVALTGDDWSQDMQWAFAKGFSIARGEATLTWAGDDSNTHANLNALRASRDWAVAMINGAPQDIYPESLINHAIAEISRVAPEHVSYEVIKGDELLEQGWIGVHSVGRASSRVPAMLVLDYNPTGDTNAPVAAALVGKGITFDSGGYSIKSGAGMAAMKCDMGGSATVTAALSLAISQGLNKRVKLILCCAENLINGSAYKLGDILTYKNGLTVEILNTDAEGRLVLADGLMVAGETGAPLIIDAATLTGAALTAVGTQYNAVFGFDNELAQRAIGYGHTVNELNWQLPLNEFHKWECPSPYADTANTTMAKSGVPGASNAAGFLAHFVPNDGKGWLHFDIAACFQTSGTAKWSAGATGVGIETIAQILLQE
ncbi:aminopeptidase PepB [Psychrobium sp. 1_MG-2023]|uniref:aminopeptidase PepB n=1 Tax=Psychrobium sp. 1_MG-2023 TaxID=3062624 RepID=UPI000C33B348|nr:aminopeptidase PepB [Psychrobium sp. 1_MG-2023]MDP2561483.1 aminopeptidase PepB [Psychrobium sp. 1_MG-2023]PKF57749.1 aminopeptidase PepB [Alteromonadales bacterium alter-6D02]